MKIVIIIALALLVLLDYAMCCVAHDADERAEKMVKKWAEEHKDRVDEIVNNLEADFISADKILVKEKDDDRNG